jgi:hypothetical protein
MAGTESEIHNQNILFALDRIRIEQKLNLTKEEKSLLRDLLYEAEESTRIDDDEETKRLVISLRTKLLQ